MKNESDDDNFSLLPRDSTGPKKRDELDRFDFGVHADHEDGRFSVLLSNGADQNYSDVNTDSGSRRKPPPSRTGQSTAQLGKNANAGQMDSSTKELQVSGEDYQKAYLRKQRQAAGQAQDTTEKKQQEKAALDKSAHEKESAMRARARDLYEQIQYWKRESGMGNHDEQHISGMVSSLEQQLNAIDPKYWM